MPKRFLSRLKSLRVILKSLSDDVTSICVFRYYDFTDSKVILVLVLLGGPVESLQWGGSEYYETFWTHEI